MTSTCRTAAVIVTYGDRGVTTLEAVRSAATAGVDKSIVVMNGRDCSAAIALEAGRLDPDISVQTVSLDINGGSAAGFRAGLDAAIRLAPEYVWLLDDDNRPDPDALERAFVAMKEAERRFGGGHVAVSCARPADRYHNALLQGQPVSDVFASAGSFQHFDLKNRIRRNRIRRRASRVPEAPKRLLPITGTVVPSGPYGGLLIPVDLVQRIGLPREDFVLYEDDVEYTQRIAAEGAALVFAPTAIVRETDKPVTDIPEQPLPGSPRPLLRMLQTQPQDFHRLYYQYRNRSFIDHARATGSARGVFWLNAAVYLLAATSLAIAHRRDVTATSVFYRAIRDGLFGRLGRTYPL